MTIKAKKDIINAGTSNSLSNDSIVIKAGSFVYDNIWINFNGIIFKARDYILSSLVAPRTHFFNNLNYAVCLIVGIDINGSIQVIEGNQVLYTTNDSIPLPATYDIIPLISLILIQDGSNDLNYGFRPIKDTDITYFSGVGNAIEKNLVGDNGADSDIIGYTGLPGVMGLTGNTGVDGDMGPTGFKGLIGDAPAGDTGLQGITGINWDFRVPFEIFQ